MTEPAHSPEADGSAALGICESLLLALTDLKVISDQDARDLLQDVAISHEQAALTSPAPDRHHAIVKVIQRIIAGQNGVRQ